MKLWIKLALLFTLLINLIIEMGLYYINPKVEDFSIDLVGEKLKSISASIAAGIDGDKFKELDLFDSTSASSETYQKLKKTIKQAKESLELSEDLYTILVLDKNSIAFGVVLNTLSSSMNRLLEISAPAKMAVTKVYKNKHCEYTSMYQDKYGSWLSGLAPIYDSNKNVVGIIQVDQKFELVANRIKTIISIINIGRLYLIPIIIIFSILFSMFFLLPITKVKEKIIKIAGGDYEESDKIKSGGEIKELVDAAENLRITILKQQSKIFNSISELEEAKDRAETSDKLKSEFLAVLSHEIRTPLNVILGNIGILELELEDSGANEFQGTINSIKVGSHRLIRTVDMIVLYSELTTGNYNKTEKFVSIDKLFFDIVNSYKIEAKENGVELIIECSATTNKIKADDYLLQEAIKQLVDNAVKYSNSGEIKFCIVNNDDDGISIFIKDEGIGISEEFMKEVFKPFRQEDMSYNRRYEGNGLGLALSKKSCDINEFNLIINSEKDKGTTVEINIPKRKLFNF